MVVFTFEHLLYFCSWPTQKNTHMGTFVWGCATFIALPTRKLLDPLTDGHLLRFFRSGVLWHQILTFGMTVGFWKMGMYLWPYVFQIAKTFLLLSDTPPENEWLEPQNAGLVQMINSRVLFLRNHQKLANQNNGRLQFWHDEEERTELASLLALISGGWLVAMGLCQAVSLFGTFELFFWVDFWVIKKNMHKKNGAGKWVGWSRSCPHSNQQYILIIFEIMNPLVW